MHSSGARSGGRRIFAAVAAIALVFLVLFSADLVGYRGQELEKERIVSESLTRLLSVRIDGAIRELDFVLRDVADKEHSGLRGADLQRIAEAKRATLSQASSLSIVDASGRVLASSPAFLDCEAERGSITFFLADPSLDCIMRACNSDGGSALVYSRAIRDSSGRLEAAVAARIEPGIIQDLLSSAGAENQGRVFAMADPLLRLVARVPPLPSAVGSGLADEGMRALLTHLKYSPPGIAEMSSESGAAVYFARSGEFHTYVVMEQSKSAILAEWRRRFCVYAALMAGIAILLAAIARLLAKNFARNSELAARLVAMESASDVLVIADLEGKVEYVNAAFERITGVPKSAALGSRRALFGLSDPEAEAALAAVRAGELWRGEIETRRADGALIVEEVTIAPVLGLGGEPERLVAGLRDITERRRLQEKLERLAHYDSLTGLPNRTLFFDRLDGAVARAKREGRRFALLFLDLDGFKAVNDSYGHDAGDYLLFELGKRLRASIRDSDTAGRMGGDEFTVLLENISHPEDATAVAEKIRAAICAPAALPEGTLVTVGASIGIAVFPEDGEDGEAVLKAADSAMYAVKLASGNPR
jgi:PAS domain S-box/diguanylate cyclase (GGDEF) domain